MILTRTKRVMNQISPNSPKRTMFKIQPPNQSWAGLNASKRTAANLIRLLNAPRDHNSGSAATARRRSIIWLITSSWCKVRKSGYAATATCWSSRGASRTGPGWLRPRSAYAFRALTRNLSWRRNSIKNGSWSTRQNSRRSNKRKWLLNRGSNKSLWWVCNNLRCSSLEMANHKWCLESDNQCLNQTANARIRPTNESATINVTSVRCPIPKQIFKILLIYIDRKLKNILQIDNIF